jgi:hypothetical protein
MSSRISARIFPGKTNLPAEPAVVLQLSKNDQFGLLATRFALESAQLGI